MSQRLGQLLEKYGVAGLAWRIITKPFRAAWWWGQHRFNEGSYVWKFDPEADVPPRHIQGLEVASYARYDDIPNHVIEALKDDGTVQETFDWMREEIDSGRSSFSVGELEGVPAGYLFLRNAGALHEWFIPLGMRDVVMYRVRTFLDFRGRGISPTLQRAVVLPLAQSGTNVYADCSIHNHPSQRSLTKAGFRNLGRFKPLKKQSVKLR